MQRNYNRQGRRKTAKKMKVEITIYRVSNGQLNYSPISCKYNSQDWEQFLVDSGQTERLERLRSLSSKERSPKLYRMRKTPSFQRWSEQHPVDVTSTPYKRCVAEVDGRLNESDVRVAIMRAVEEGRNIAKVYPRSNKTKPSHLWLVYEFTFQEYLL